MTDPTNRLLAQRELECWIEGRAFEMWLGFLTPLKWGVIVGTITLSAIGGAPVLRQWLGDTWVTAVGVCALISALLMALHTGLRCDEHQSECRRLIQVYTVFQRDYERAQTLPASAMHTELERLDNRLAEETRSNEDASRGICQAACMAHVRRKFYDLEQAHASPIASEALRRIAELYAIEGEIRGRPPDERKQTRQTRARLLLDSIEQWLNSTLGKLSKKSAVAAAIHYALGRWPALLRYCDDGHLEIDNNAAERALRVVVLGRKNYLFAGSDSGGERAASIYSLIGTAKLNGLDSEAYLRDVLSRISDHPINRIGELLPWNTAITHS